MKKFSFVILLLLPLIGFGQAEKRYRSIIIDSVKALNQDTIDFKSFAQFDSSVAIGAGNVDASAILTMISTRKGLLTPRMNTTERDAISSPADGLLIFNTQTNQFEFFETTWQAIGGGGVSFGTNEQIPFTNPGGTDFDYSANFIFNEAAQGAGIDRLEVGGTTNGRFQLFNSSDVPIISMTSDFNSFFDQDVSIGHSGVPISGNNLDVHQGIIMRGAKSSPGITNVSNSPVFTTRGQFNFTGTPDVFDGGIQVLVDAPASDPQTGRLAFTVDGNTGLTVDESQTTTVIGINATSTDFSFIATDNVTTELFKIRNDGQTIIEGELSTTKKDLTLGVADVTFVTTGNVMEITGDGGGNTIATITGALSGQYLIMIFVDDKVTITDDNGHGANTIDLSAAFSSLDDTTLTLTYDGTSWYETSRSVN